MTIQGLYRTTFLATFCLVGLVAHAQIPTTTTSPPIPSPSPTLTPSAEPRGFVYFSTIRNANREGVQTLQLNSNDWESLHLYYLRLSRNPARLNKAVLEERLRNLMWTANTECTLYKGQQSAAVIWYSLQSGQAGNLMNDFQKSLSSESAECTKARMQYAIVRSFWTPLQNAQDAEGDRIRQQHFDEVIRETTAIAQKTGTLCWDTVGYFLERFSVHNF